jgi:hypothetical protein
LKGCDVDLQTCRVCDKEFDFDKSGFGSTRGGVDFLVCSETCGKKAATVAGNLYVIHDGTDKIVEHNCPDGEELNPGLARV